MWVIAFWWKPECVIEKIIKKWNYTEKYRSTQYDTETEFE